MIQDEALIVETSRRNKYVCPEKGCDLIPEILSANSDIGIIVLKCEKHGEITKDVEEYLNTLKEEKKDINPKEPNVDYQEENDLDNSKKLILDKSKDLSSIIKAHIKILDSQEKNPDNYFHNQNIINLGYFLKDESNNYLHDEKKKIFKTIDDIRKEEIDDKNENEKGILDTLKNEYYIDLEKYLRSEEELYLKLKGPKKESEYLKYLKDDGFILVSQLRFKNLKEINFANNFITKLDPLNNMLLPHLEIINFSDNLIEYITPLANLFSEKLSEIYLQNNKIQDLGPFLNSKFPLLDIFRVDGEGNKNAFKKNSFKAVQKKYKNILFYEAKSWDDFNKEYEFNCREKNYQDIFKLDLGSRRKEKILIDLFPLIIYPNNIKSLILDDNKLQDVSLLSRMPLYNLELLDLSLNFINNIKFLKKISKKWKKLIVLYLNDNKLNDISPLVTYDDKNGVDLIIKFQALTLKNNYLDLKDKTTKEILEELIHLDEEKKTTVDYEKKDLDGTNNNDTENKTKKIKADVDKSFVQK